MVNALLLNYFGRVADCLSWRSSRKIPWMEHKPLFMSFNSHSLLGVVENQYVIHMPTFLSLMT